VADMLGLNDSKYQWVIDAMDEHDWKVAQEVQQRRLGEENAVEQCAVEGMETPPSDIDFVRENIDETKTHITSSASYTIIKKSEAAVQISLPERTGS